MFDISSSLISTTADCENSKNSDIKYKVQSKLRAIDLSMIPRCYVRGIRLVSDSLSSVVVGGNSGNMRAKIQHNANINIF